MAIAISTPDGQLPNSKGTLYTVPALTKAYVKSISLVNVGASTEAVSIWVKPGATSRLLASATLLVGEKATIGAFGLDAGDLIEGSSTNAASVDYVVSVVEES